ncbi:unnamed protein product [Auanema sp. JU1783]|nr:unnamed protein product [Auanema sp. JU1783]
MGFRTSCDGNRGEYSFPFEFLPREIKEKILERVMDETADFDEFKKFWRLKRVNKEFYSILNSNYAKRHFLKYPCWLVFDAIQVYPGTDEETTSDEVQMTVYWPRTPCRPCKPFRPWRSYRGEHIFHDKKIVYDDVRRGYSQFVRSSHLLRWRDVPRYLRDKPFRIDLVQIVPFVSTVHMLPTIVELANQATESFGVAFRPVDQDNHANDSSSAHSLTRSVHEHHLTEFFWPFVIGTLKEVEKTGKIFFDFKIY